MKKIIVVILTIVLFVVIGCAQTEELNQKQTAIAKHPQWAQFYTD